MRSILFESIGTFVLRVLMKHAIFLIGWLGIHMNLGLVVLILTSHPLASLLMPLFCVKFTLVLIMTATLIPIIFLMMALLGLVV